MSVSNLLESGVEQNLEALDRVSPEVLSDTYPKDEELLLQQLIQSRFWRCRQERLGTNTDPGLDPETQLHGGLPKQWHLTRGLTLHDWQERCVSAWFNNHMRGVIKVVTGAGKTVLALAIAERLQGEDKELRVAIIVPTTVLLHQWLSEFSSRSNLPANAIGLIGGGHNDRFDENVRVLICVLNSASKKLPNIVTKAGVDKSLLMIVDECHRAGAAQMRQVFRTKRKYNLGLSATPEREDQFELDDAEIPDVYRQEKPAVFEDSVIGQELGDVIFEMNYAEALRLGVLPPFTIIHYGLSLLPVERTKYERVSREIKDLRSELETSSRKGLALIRWCRSKAAAGNSKAARLIGLTSERKRLVYRMSERSAAVLKILQDAFAENSQTKAILFHESIIEVMNLFEILRRNGFSVVAEHSQFPDSMRADSLRLFREGKAQIIVSARSLIEGYNIPSADVGIIVAASSSVRQRVQTLGRLLRKVQRPDGSEKEARLYVLYANQTVDELIYEKADWKEFVGAERNEYFLWPHVEGSEPLAQTGPPRQPPASEANVNVATLQPGDSYPGNPDEGRIYSLDTQGNITDEDKKLVKPSPELGAILENSRKKGGRFRITPRNQFVVELGKFKDGWQGIYLGQLTQPLEMVESSSNDQDNGNYSPGERYPLDRVEGKTFSVLQRDKRLIAKKSSKGIHFVIDSKSIEDVEKRDALELVQRELARAYANGHRISKIRVTRKGHVIYVYEGEAYFLGNAPEGAEGFTFEG